MPNIRLDLQVKHNIAKQKLLYIYCVVAGENCEQQQSYSSDVRSSRVQTARRVRQFHWPFTGVSVQQHVVWEPQTSIADWRWRTSHSQCCYS